MNSTALHNIIQNPNEAGEHERDLASLVKTYPWFSSGHILLAKSMHQNASIHYDDQLHLSAVYAGERKVLFDLIIRAIDETKGEEILDISTQKDKIPSTEETEKVIDVNSEIDKTEEKEIQVEDEDSLKPSTKKEIDDLEKEIIIGAVSSTIEKEVEEDSSELREELKEQELEDSPTLPSPIIEDEKEETYSEYTQWLLKRSRQIEFSNQKQEQADIELPSSENSLILHNEKDILDRFIKNNPHITRGKIDDFSSDCGFKESLREDESLITETMAQIYAQQGKISKAKKAYKLLSLKYPEKSIYFAGRIKNLEGKK